MWVINRYGDVVVDIPPGMDQNDAFHAIAEYVDQDLDDDGAMDALFSEEEKMGPPEAGETVIDSVQDAEEGTTPHLRLVENDGEIQVVVVEEDVSNDEE